MLSMTMMGMTLTLISLLKLIMMSNSRTYLADTFEGNSATKWRHDSKKAAISIEDNGAERDLLTGIKQAITPTLSIFKRLSGKNLDDLNEADFASLYLNRD